MSCSGFCRLYARILIILGWVLLAYSLYFYNYAAFCGWKYDSTIPIAHVAAPFKDNIFHSTSLQNIQNSFLNIMVQIQEHNIT
jgi:hypothetical protein